MKGGRLTVDRKRDVLICNLYKAESIVGPSSVTEIFSPGLVFPSCV